MDCWICPAWEMSVPLGSLAIWKMNKNTNTKQLLKTKSEVYEDTENCTHVVNLTTTYNLTKEDNGAVIRCSSQNQFTTEPAPATDIGPIEVLCKLWLFNVYLPLILSHNQTTNNNVFIYKKEEKMHNYNYQLERFCL